jgi:hypothetical protein
MDTATCGPYPWHQSGVTGILGDDLPLRVDAEPGFRAPGPGRRGRNVVVDVDTWLRRYADAVGVPPPDDDTVETLLAVASVAARASERRAAPLTCWLAGAAGLTATEALALAEQLTDVASEPAAGGSDQPGHDHPDDASS